MTTEFDDRELATVLAALRYWRREGWISEGHEHDIASCGGTLEPLSHGEIDALGDRLNLEPDPNEAEPSEHPVSICNSNGGMPLSAKDCETLVEILECAVWPRPPGTAKVIEQFCNVLRGHKPSEPPCRESTHE